MNPSIVLAAIVAVALVYVLLPVVAEAFLRFRAKRQLWCPEEGTTAEVGVDARRAALTSAFRDPLLRVKSCSLWPERKGCGQPCLVVLDGKGREPLRQSPDVPSARAEKGRDALAPPRPTEGPARIREWMTRASISVAPATPVSEAWELMRRKRIRHLLVTEGESLVGIITDRDVRLNLPSPATSLSAWEVSYLLNKLTVEQVMTRSVITIGPDRQVADAVRLMLEHRIGALPVTEDGGLLGIITETDLLRAFGKALEERSESAAA